MTHQAIGNVHGHPQYEPANSPYWKAKVEELIEKLKVTTEFDTRIAWIASAQDDSWKSIYETLAAKSQEAQHEGERHDYLDQAETISDLRQF